MRTRGRTKGARREEKRRKKRGMRIGSRSVFAIKRIISERLGRRKGE